MTNADKAELRALMREGDKRSDREIANDIGCSKATVAKYRKVFAK